MADKIVIFGGSGFLGSHTADILTDAGFDITIYDFKPSPYLKKNQKIVVGDILDRELVEKTLEGADIVYNFAGIVNIEESNLKPYETILNNVLGNTILLEASRKQGVKRFIFASSIYVYSNSGSFYRSSKQACELIIESYYKSYGLNFTILRYGSLYGPRSNENNGIYHMINQALEHKMIIRSGDGEEIREFVNVIDAARMSVEVLNDEYKNQFVIISGNQQIKIKDLLTMIKEMLKGGIDIKYVSPVESEHYEITPYVFNPKLAKRLVLKDYIDLGQGILNMIGEIYTSKKHELNLHEELIR